MRLELQRLDPDLPLPDYATEGDAGIDLHARDGVLLEPLGGRATVPTGIAVAIEAGHVGYVLPRSGLAAQHGVTVLNAPGVVDSGYRGEIVVVLINHDPEQAYEVRRGDRIAQLMITTAISVEVTDVEKLPMSRRGSAGLGESGR